MCVCMCVCVCVPVVTGCCCLLPDQGSAMVAGEESGGTVNELCKCGVMTNRSHTGGANWSDTTGFSVRYDQLS